jgi:hypothetical protein
MWERKLERQKRESRRRDIKEEERGEREKGLLKEIKSLISLS